MRKQSNGEENAKQMTIDPFGSEPKQRYRKPEAVKQLERMHERRDAELHPNVPYLTRRTYRDDTANGLTQCVISYIELNGGQAERINTTGRIVMTTTKQWRNGHIVDVKTPKMIPTNGVVGSADISATIGGRSVKIEIKIGRDRQSEAQKNYQSSIERAGGLYYIARDFTTFVEWYNGTFGL